MLVFVAFGSPDSERGTAWACGVWTASCLLVGRSYLPFGGTAISGGRTFEVYGRLVHSDACWSVLLTELGWLSTCLASSAIAGYRATLAVPQVTTLSSLVARLFGLPDPETAAILHYTKVQPVKSLIGMVLVYTVASPFLYRVES